MTPTSTPGAGRDIQFIDYEYSADAMVELALDVNESHSDTTLLLISLVFLYTKYTGWR